jgi:hypothetical protein
MIQNLCEQNQRCSSTANPVPYRYKNNHGLKTANSGGYARRCQAAAVKSAVAGLRQT